MGLRDRYGEHLRKQDVKFRETHLGAERKSGDAGGTPYPYIAYHESNAAAFLELCSILSVIFGMGLMIVLPTGDSSVPAYLAWLAGIVIVNRAFAAAARSVNNRQVREKITLDADYARYFAAAYPEQAHLCTELNELYAMNPDAEPAPDTQMQQKTQAARDKKLKTIITAAYLGFLLVLFLALMAFCVWAMHENI